MKFCIAILIALVSGCASYSGPKSLTLHPIEEVEHYTFIFEEASHSDEEQFQREKPVIEELIQTLFSGSSFPKKKKYPSASSDMYKINGLTMQAEGDYVHLVYVNGDYHVSLGTELSTNVVATYKFVWVESSKGFMLSVFYPKELKVRASRNGLYEWIPTLQPLNVIEQDVYQINRALKNRITELSEKQKK